MISQDFNARRPGAYTGLATRVAEALDADWNQMVVEAAPADVKFYGHPRLRRHDARHRWQRHDARIRTAGITIV